MQITPLIRKRCIHLINLIIAFSYGFGVYAFHRNGKPFIQGFYCDDESISKPFKKSTIPSLQGSIVIACIAIVCFCVGEFIQISDKRKICNNEKKDLKKWSTDVIFLILLSIFGAGITMFITDIGKYTIGRPRPHFFAVCKPNWLKINCTDSIGLKNYIIGNEFCTTTDPIALKEARLSFPSGHSSFSAFFATFLILYIQLQIKCEKWGSMPKIFIQVILGSAGFYVGLSRVSDFKHHPTDVLVGFIIGIFIGVVLHCIVRKFYYSEEKICSILPNTDRRRDQESTGINL